MGYNRRKPNKVPFPNFWSSPLARRAGRAPPNPSGSLKGHEKHGSTHLDFRKRNPHHRFRRGFARGSRGPPSLRWPAEPALLGGRPPFAEPIQRRRIVDENAIADRFLRRPVGQEVEQDRVVRLGVGLSRSDAANRCPRPFVPARPSRRPARPSRHRRSWADPLSNPGRRSKASPRSDPCRSVFSPTRRRGGRPRRAAERAPGDRTLFETATFAEAPGFRRSGRRACGSVRAKPKASTRFDSGSSISIVVVPGLHQIEADAADPEAVEPLQFGVGDAGIDHADAAGRAAELGDRVERDGIVGAVGRRRHDHVASRADPLLQPAIVVDGRIRAVAASRWARPENDDQ